MAFISCPFVGETCGRVGVSANGRMGVCWRTDFQSVLGLNLRVDLAPYDEQSSEKRPTPNAHTPIDCHWHKKNSCLPGSSSGASECFERRPKAIE